MKLHEKLRGIPFPPPVGDPLRVEGDGPGHKVDPADHLVYDADDIAVDHGEEYPWAGEKVGTGMSWGWTSGGNPTCQHHPPSHHLGPIRAEASLPGLVGVISVQISGNLSDILRRHLKRGICHAGRDHNLLGKLNQVQCPGVIGTPAPGHALGNGGTGHTQPLPSRSFLTGGRNAGLISQLEPPHISVRLPWLISEGWWEGPLHLTSHLISGNLFEL